MKHNNTQRATTINASNIRLKIEASRRAVNSSVAATLSAAPYYLRSPGNLFISVLLTNLLVYV